MVCRQSKFGNPNNMGRWRMPTQAVEEYLESIYKMEKRGLPVIGARLAEEIGVSPPTVAEMLTRLCSKGYVDKDPGSSVVVYDFAPFGGPVELTVDGGRIFVGVPVAERVLIGIVEDD